MLRWCLWSKRNLRSTDGHRCQGHNSNNQPNGHSKLKLRCRRKSMVTRSREESRSWLASRNRCRPLWTGPGTQDTQSQAPSQVESQGLNPPPREGLATSTLAMGGFGRGRIVQPPHIQSIPTPSDTLFQRFLASQMAQREDRIVIDALGGLQGTDARTQTTAFGRAIPLSA